MKYKYGDVLITIEKQPYVDTYRFILLDRKDSMSFNIKAITYSYKHDDFEESYIDNQCVIDKEYIWKKELEEIINV